MLITVIMPVYNTAKWLGESLDSLLAQTFGDWEAICVDDGSTDDSPGILDEYARRDRRIRVIHKKNEGVSIARNTALAEADGEWVGFVDSDDLLECDWLQKVANELRKRPVDLVRCGFKWMFEGESGTRIVGRGKKNFVALSNSDEVMRWGWGVWPREGMVWMCFYRREMLAPSGVVFEPGSALLEDMFFNMRLLPYINSMAQIDNDGYLYRQRDGSALRCGRRTFVATEQILRSGLDVYVSQQKRLEALGLFPLAFKQMFLLVWGNCGSWLFAHPQEEKGKGADVRRLAKCVLLPCVKDRFPWFADQVKGVIANGLGLLCGSMLAHWVCRYAFRMAWNTRDVVRRLTRKN